MKHTTHTAREEETSARILPTSLGIVRDPLTLPSSPLHHATPPIHRSAWKGYSPKFVCSIMHSPGPIGPEIARLAFPATPRGHYMLWVRIKMQEVATSERFNQRQEALTGGVRPLSRLQQTQ